MSLIDDLLDKYKVKYEDLNTDEVETLHTWLNAIDQSKVTTGKIREYLQSMKSSVEEQLSKEPEYIKVGFWRVRNDNNILLKARLRNYLLLERFLLTPERARNQLESMLAGMTPSA